MPFADTELEIAQKPTYRKAEYLDLAPGENIIRILQQKAIKKWTHYINGVSVECLGEDCPICENNKKLIFEFPDSFRQQAGYSARTRRFYVNVLDKTPVKICPNCQKEVKKMGKDYPPMCPSCNTLIVKVEDHPLNKVKVLAKGVTLFEPLNALETYVLDEQREPIGITNFDIALIVAGAKGREQKINPLPRTQDQTPVDISEEMLFDLSKCLLTLTSEELVLLTKGVKVRDILLGRQKTHVESDTKEISADIERAVEELFG